ncbi:MAG: asparagine synthase (glutamine-hydrolyzing) [Desulfovibrionaceae bacterium]|nr:asparagine synthase (glutamine-hydrolyzing) [Desulfovibrionaceae bacterium]
MSGIIGTLRYSGNVTHFVEPDLVPLRHRGPDGEGFYHDSRISLGHTRLAVLDLSGQATQPMRSHDGRYAIVHNGAIYNHPELRSQLEAAGTRFATRSDTEVILEAYRHWGKSCIKHFRGMFALAIWDTLEEILFLARDRCGERPLIYYRDAERFIFASEIKALVPLLPCRPALDPAVVDMYLHYQYTPEPFTLLQGVRKLPAAHTLTLSKDQFQDEPERYWCVEDTPSINGLPTDTPGILQCIREALEESITLALHADVPVGVALSGGIDSGAIAALAQKNYPEPMHAFSVGYPGRPPYDEREQAKALAKTLGMIFHEVEIPIDQFVDFFPELVRVMDEPIADPAAFGHYTVPKAARDMGIKVLLGGLGGDELFWGYDWVAQAARLNQALPAAPGIWQRLAKAVLPTRLRRRMAPCEVMDLTTPAGFLHFYDLTPDFSHAKMRFPAIYGPAMRDLPRLNAYRPTDIGPRAKEQAPAAVIRLLFDTWLAACLNLGDRVSMGVGVETRLPFLDPNLIELIMTLRRQTPDHHLGQKAWLRAALKGTLPDDVLVRPKRGFQPPVWEWLNSAVERYGDTLRDGQLEKQGILETATIHDILHKKGTSWNNLFVAYKLVLLESWVSGL